MIVLYLFTLLSVCTVIITESEEEVKSPLTKKMKKLGLISKFAFYF